MGFQLKPLKQMLKINLEWHGLKARRKVKQGLNVLGIVIIKLKRLCIL